MALHGINSAVLDAARNAALNAVQAVPAAAEAWALLRTIPRLPDAAGPQCGLADAPARSADSLAARSLVVIGESTAAGVGAPTQQTALGGRLALALAAHTGRAVRWQAVGQNGATMRRIRYRLLPAAVGGTLTVAVIAAGANDVLRGRRTTEWEEHLRAIVAGLRGSAFGSEPLVVLTGVPPFSQFPSLRSPLRPYLARRALRIDTRSAQLCSELGVLFVPFIEHEIDLGPDFFAADGFHPSAAGYALWAEYIAEKIAEQLPTGNG